MADRNTPDRKAYALETVQAREVEAPELHYQPPVPRSYRPAIGLIGAGGISAAHLDAYAGAKFNVTAICDVNLDRAALRRDEFFPSAKICTDVSKVFTDPEIEVVDLSVHPAPRVALMEQALKAGKHVLSQKPYVLDLDVGERLVSLAKERGRGLAVNMNGRWAPHLSYMRAAVKAGLIGSVHSIEVSLQWDHSWVAGTPFGKIDDLILFDFGIHWFDFVASLIGSTSTGVFATRAAASGQPISPPMLAQVFIAFPKGQASIVFNAFNRYQPSYRCVISGSLGTLISDSDQLSTGAVTIVTAAGRGQPKLTGSWFNDGFLGTMGELLSAIEDGREAENSAANCIDGLALCFAAVQSSHSGKTERPREVRRIKID